MTHYDACAGVYGFADAAMVPEVDVAAADADVCDADEEGVGVGEGGGWGGLLGRRCGRRRGLWRGFALFPWFLYVMASGCVCV